jgi:hypothetical protein
VCLRCLLAIALLAGSTVVTGCWMAAIQFAPLAIKAVEAVGSGATNLASNAAAARAGQRGDDEVDRQERCDELEDAAPSVIEFRRAEANASAQWRELRLDHSAGDPTWIAAIVPGSGTEWRPTENLPTMKFVPPLARALKPGIPDYLAYAPAEPLTPLEDDQLSSMTVEFGAGTGTFQWNGRVYQYAVADKLPCFPVVDAMK